MHITQDVVNVLVLILTNQPEKLSSLTYLKEISDYKVIYMFFNFSAVSRLRVRKLYIFTSKEQAMYDNLCEFLASY